LAKKIFADFLSDSNFPFEAEIEAEHFSFSFSVSVKKRRKTENLLHLGGRSSRTARQAHTLGTNGKNPR